MGLIKYCGQRLSGGFTVGTATASASGARGARARG